jgi:hypothetical protein
MRSQSVSGPPVLSGIRARGLSANPQKTGSPEVEGMIDAQRQSDGWPTEAVAHVIRHHENTTSSWAFSGMAARLNTLYDGLNTEFFNGRLPKAVISVGPDLIVRYGTYRVGRDELGVQHRIHLNTRHFGRSEARVAVTLLHEMMHACQHLFGTPGRRARYHNAEFVALCAAAGFTCQIESGVTLDVSDGLLSTLNSLGFSATRQMMPDADDSPVRRPVRKRLLRCSCGREVWSLCDQDGRVVCLDCGAPFVWPADSRPVPVRLAA